MVLVLSKRDYTKIVTHSKKVYPIEACGLLVGVKRSGKKVVLEVRKTPNVLNSSSRYEVDPEIELQVFMDAEKKSFEVVGIYHSHSFWAARPSSIDSNLAVFENVSYVIYSVTEDSLASYTWNGSIFEPEETEIQ
jgi:proteasome lid subunit RPN8/RPN11